MVFNLIEASEYIVEFKLGYFLSFFIYHLIVYFGGPVGALVISAIEGRRLTYNMFFWPRHEPTFYFQLFQYVAWAFMTYLFLAHPLKNCYATEYYSICVYYVFRAFIIAVRYSFMSRVRMRNLKETFQSYAFISMDFFGESWLDPGPAAIEREVKAVFWRN